MKRIVLFAGIIAATTSLSSCSWYWETSKDIGSHMPTYEGWFGDGEKKEQQLAPVPQYNQQYNNQGMSLNQVSQQPLERRLPLSGNPEGSYQPKPVQQPQYNQQGYGYTQPQGSPPFPPPQAGQPLPNAGSFPPPQGFSASDVPSANDVPPPPPGYGNPPPQQGQQGGPDPAAGLRNLEIQQQQGQQPLIPFTEPTLENFSETIIEEKPAEGATFSFLSDIGDVIGGWFDSEPAKEFPNLASVPETSEYDAKMEEAKAGQQELEADKEAAQAQQAAIKDWSELAEEETPTEPVTALSSITSPTGNEVVVPRDLPAEEVVLPEPKLEQEKAPETVVIMQKPQAMPEPQPMPKMEDAPAIAAPVAEEAPAPAAPIVIADEQPITETKAEFLRKPSLPSGIKLLPRNRYAQ